MLHGMQAYNYYIYMSLAHTINKRLLWHLFSKPQTELANAAYAKKNTLLAVMMKKIVFFPDL